MRVTELYDRYQTELHRLAASALTAEAFRRAVHNLAADLERDLAALSPEDRTTLCDDLGTQLERELYRATNERRRRILAALLKVVDSHR